MGMTRKRVLVTGGAGFLGSHLCERLLANGHSVLCVDNYFTGAKDNIAHLLGNPHFEAMRHDITFPLYVEIDEIFNLACPASPYSLSVRPGADHEDQRGRRHQHARPGQTHARKGVPGLHQRGCMATPTISPQPESYRGNVNPLGPRACYDEGKRLCGDAVFRLSPPARHAREGGAHFQHLRAAHASARRPRCLQFHHPGAHRAGTSPFTAMANRHALSVLSMT